MFNLHLRHPFRQLPLGPVKPIEHCMWIRLADGTEHLVQNPWFSSQMATIVDFKDATRIMCFFATPVWTSVQSCTKLDSVTVENGDLTIHFCYNFLLKNP